MDVGRSKPKALGSGARFVDELGKVIGAIRSIRMNSDGTKISILADRTSGSSKSLRLPVRSHLYLLPCVRVSDVCPSEAMCVRVINRRSCDKPVLVCLTCVRVVHVFVCVGF